MMPKQGHNLQFIDGIEVCIMTFAVGTAAGEKARHEQLHADARAEAHAREIAEEAGRIASLKVVEGIDENGNSMTLNDVPLCFGMRKKYADRLVTVIDIADNT